MRPASWWSPDHFAQLFTTHGTIMIFFMAMPFLTGLINYVMPLQIGARDMAFPWANSVALWLTGGARMLMMVSLVIGQLLHRRLERLSALYRARPSARMSGPITGSGR